MVGVKKEVDMLVNILEKIDNLCNESIDKALLSEYLKILLLAYEKMTESEMKKLFERKVYSLYATIVDEIFSAAEEKDVEEFIVKLGLLTLEKYNSNEKLMRRV